MSDLTLRLLQRSEDQAAWLRHLVRVGQIFEYGQALLEPRFVTLGYCARPGCDERLDWSVCSYCVGCRDFRQIAVEEPLVCLDAFDYWSPEPYWSQSTCRCCH